MKHVLTSVVLMVLLVGNALAETIRPLPRPEVTALVFTEGEDRITIRIHNHGGAMVTEEFGDTSVAGIIFDITLREFLGGGEFRYYARRDSVLFDDWSWMQDREPETLLVGIDERLWIWPLGGVKMYLASEDRYTTLAPSP